jgi:hypothetical protein
MFLHIHGDNIVECERAWRLLTYSLDLQDVRHEDSRPVTPERSGFAAALGARVRGRFYPGFGRWTSDVAQFFRDRGGMLREKPDAVLSLVGASADPGSERPVVALEYCSALDAGNQAWQRCGRAYSALLSGVPYLYITEIGGLELDADRNPKAARWPTPVVPFAYARASLVEKSLCLPVFVPAAVLQDDADEFAPCYGTPELALILKALLLGETPDSPVSTLSAKALLFTETISARRKRFDTYRSPLWGEWLASESSVEFLAAHPLPWLKKTKAEQATSSARGLMDAASGLSLAPGACEVPFCLIPKHRRSEFAHIVGCTYDGLLQEFLEWLERDSDLVVAWVMGFKPAGEDARPDRGLPPLARMAVGRGVDLLTVVYGPAKPDVWTKLHEAPQALRDQNGLWESILACSDAILVDSRTDHGRTRHGYTAAHWEGGAHANLATQETMASPEPFPAVTGEQDVDTVLHLMMTSLAPPAFEGLCNPPGGDWSGLSLLARDAQYVHRWLSLPRVSHSGAKRPDHVFQLSGDDGSWHVLVVESKRSRTRLEKDIGPRLIRYVDELARTPASATGATGAGQLHRNLDGTQLDLGGFSFVSGVAVLVPDGQAVSQMAQDLDVDLAIGLEILPDSTTVWMKAASAQGAEVAETLRVRVPEGHLGIAVNVL